MNQYAPYVLAAVNLCFVILLATNRWVHKMTGQPSLEARMKLVEDAVHNANIRFSDKMSDLTKYLEMRRSDHDDTVKIVSELQGEMRVMRGYRREGDK